MDDNSSQADAAWALLLSAPRHAASSLLRRDVPALPGLYAWFRDGACVYIGIAASLRSRLSAHRAQGADLSRSTLRASVAVGVLGITRKHARARPSLLTAGDVEPVNQWLAECDVSWLVCGDRAEAEALEHRLLNVRPPALNLAP